MVFIQFMTKFLKSLPPPFVAKNDASASRNFLSGVRKMPHVKDLELYRIGNWSPEDMKMSCFYDEPALIPFDFGGEDE